MTAEPLPWAARLREERCRRGWSQRQMALRLYRAADERSQANLPRVEYIVRRIVSYESGEHRPRDPYVELYSRAFGIPRDVLFNGTGVAEPNRLPAAAEAEGLVTWITASNTTDEAIEHLERTASQLAEAHTRQPPRRVLEGVMDTHRHVQGLLQGGRQRLRQARELLRVDADLLAHASLLLDDIHRSRSAAAHGKAALVVAGEAGLDRAMALSAQAKTARWQGMRGGRGDRRHFALSAQLARKGYENSSAKNPIRVLLANQEASAAALLGDAARAMQGLRRAEQAAEALPADVGTTAWTCQPPRMALYALSVALRLRDPDAALRSAAQADELWDADATRPFAVWSLIRAGSAIAHVMKRDLAAAEAQMELVTKLRPDLRISTVTGYLNDMDMLLAQRRFAGVPQAAAMRERIRTFVSPAMAEAET